MSTVSVNLGIWEASQYKSLKIDVDLAKNVVSLKNEASQKTQLNSFELVYCGLVLEDDHPLASYGLQAGATIHVVKKNEIEKPPPTRTLSEIEVQQLVVAFRAFTVSSGYRAALQRLARPEVLENIIAASPGLAEDPAAYAIIQDPELIVHMGDPDTVRRVAEKHPSLIEAANYIAAHIHEEQANVDPSLASTSTGYSYSLEALSDDDEMETNQEAHPLSRNTSYNAITSAQLAAAIASATNTTFNSSSAGMPGTPTRAARSLITSEMFTSAIQQALAGPFRDPTEISNRASEIETIEAITRRLQPQLQQMHEMGLVNDSVNVRALQATSGNVEAAIELVFNGAVE